MQPGTVTQADGGLFMADVNSESLETWEPLLGCGGEEKKTEMAFEPVEERATPSPAYPPHLETEGTRMSRHRQLMQ